MEIKELISKIQYYNGTLPEKELQQIIENKEQAIPELLAILEYTRDNIDNVAKEDPYYAHMYATFLLAQFREYKAYGLIYDILCNDYETIEYLFGDCITEDLGRILASVCCNDLSLIKNLIENPEIYEYVRSAALDSLLVLFVQKELTREEIFEYFHSLFEGKLPREYSHVWNALVHSIYELYPEGLIDEIRKAYEEELAEEEFIRLSRIENQLLRSKEEVLEELYDNKHYCFIEDTIKELKPWTCFDSERRNGYLKSYSKEPLEPFCQSKTGRNEPCPCGSGKKF